MSDYRLEKGFVHVYTGNGKGKTTAALGLGLRAIGHGLKVYMIQFMKGGFNYGEYRSVKLLPNFKIVQFGGPELVNPSNPTEEDVKAAREALNHAREIIMSGEYDVVILDEINVAIDFKLIDVQDVLELIKKKPKHVELILTGRYAPSEIIKAADLVTFMREIKHPYRQGLPARKGIDY
ncbi:MAG: cob(I)yrinic acid a,c-diamide adenosyltransferase [Candidatus Baldrarchaeia archaeon]